MPSFTAPTSDTTQVQTMSSTPIEMFDMSNAQQQPGSTSTRNTSTSTEASHVVQTKKNIHATGLPSEPMIDSHGVNRGPSSVIAPNDNVDPTISTTPPLARLKTGPAIGPATDKPSPFPKESEIEGPVLYITLLLTTGARHPFRLDQKYMRKRNVEVEGNNPVNMSLYKLKELILRDWRDGEGILLLHSTDSFY